MWGQQACRLVRQLVWPNISYTTIHATHAGSVKAPVRDIRLRLKRRLVHFTERCPVNQELAYRAKIMRCAFLKARIGICERGAMDGSLDSLVSSR
jgi:hypothetical protein